MAGLFAVRREAFAVAVCGRRWGGHIVGVCIVFGGGDGVGNDGVMRLAGGGIIAGIGGVSSLGGRTVCAS
eukprot:scaffold15786_cov84-Amphora_coffeaeformis.AAC.1